MNSSIMRAVVPMLSLLLALPLPLAAHAAAQAPPPDEQPPRESQAKSESKSESTAADEQADRERRLSVEAIRGYSAERREEAMANARRAAAELDQQMAQLQARMDTGWSRMSEASRTRSQQAMADLRDRRTAMAEWYGGLRHGSAGAWAEVRSGFVRSYNELADALASARQRFDRDQDESDAGAETSDADAEASSPDPEGR